jgi:hypothetical protein
MHTHIQWISLASALLLACNNAAPALDPDWMARAPVTLDSRQHACEVAEQSSAVHPERTRGLYTGDELAQAPALTTYAGTCSKALAGSYALQVDLDVYMQDDAAAAEHDPGRGRASLLLRADVSDTSDVELRLCGLTLPERYVYATSGVTQLSLQDDAWDQPSMPVWSSRIQPASDGQLELDAFPVLLGIALTEPGASWPSYERTLELECGMGKLGSACFPDHDGDGEPGLSLRTQSEGAVEDAPYPACDHWHYAAPSAEPEPWLSGLGAEASRVFVGLRTAVQLFPRFDETCTHGSGDVQAADIVTRVLDCELADGQRCSARQATVLDARAPSFHVLAEGEVPPETFRDSREFVDEALDRSPSAGGKLTLQRLPDSAPETCVPVRSVFAR